MEQSFNSHHHFVFLTNRIGRLISKNALLKLKGLGFEIPPSCIGILAELWVQDGLTQKEIGHSIIKTKSSINKMLLQIQAAGLVIKKTDKQDKRNNRIFLTAKGKKLKQEISQFSQEMESQFLADCNAKDIAITKKVLNTLYQNILEDQQ